MKSDFSTQSDEMTSLATLSSIEEKQLISFLRNILPLVEQELDNNNSSTAFNGYKLLTSDGTDSISLWKLLTVDLEKHKVRIISLFYYFFHISKVVYPDWSKGNHYPGVVVKCELTRNKERIYDIDLSDGGGRLIGVREEYIRAIFPPDLDGRGSKSSSGKIFLNFFQPHPS